MNRQPMRWSFQVNLSTCENKNQRSTHPADVRCRKAFLKAEEERGRSASLPHVNAGCRKDLTCFSLMKSRPPARRSASLWCWWCRGLCCLERNHKFKCHQDHTHTQKKTLKFALLGVTTVLPVATERTNSESSFTSGLKEVLLSPLPPPPPPSQRDGYLSCSRSSGPLCRRTRQSDSSRAWISDGGGYGDVWLQGYETKTKPKHFIYLK